MVERNLLAGAGVLGVVLHAVGGCGRGTRGLRTGILGRHVGCRYKMRKLVRGEVTSSAGLRQSPQPPPNLSQPAAWQLLFPWQLPSRQFPFFHFLDVPLML